MSDVENNALEVDKSKSGADEAEQDRLSLGTLISQSDRSSLGSLMSSSDRSSLGSLMSSSDRSSLGSLMGSSDRSSLGNLLTRTNGASLSETLAGSLPSLKIEGTDKESDPKSLDHKQKKVSSDEGANDAGILMLHRVHREQLLQIQAKIESSIGNRLQGLNHDLQKEYARLPGNKLGGYSNEQLAFIKKNLGTAAYQDARDFNENGETLRFLDAQLRRPNEGPQSLEEWKERASLAEADVHKRVSNLPEKLQDAFARLPGTKDGKYSAEQMAFLKKFCGEEAYDSAGRYNTAIEAMRGFKQIPRLPVDGPRGGEASLPGANRDANSNEGRRAETAADRLRDLAEKPKPENAAENKYDLLRKLSEMQLAMVMKEVSRLPKDLQKEFQSLPLFKNGVGYNDAHVNFLRAHTNNLIADTMSGYIANRHYLMMRK